MFITICLARIYAPGLESMRDIGNECGGHKGVRHKGGAKNTGLQNISNA